MNLSRECAFIVKCAVFHAEFFDSEAVGAGDEGVDEFEDFGFNLVDDAFAHGELSHLERSDVDADRIFTGAHKCAFRIDRFVNSDVGDDFDDGVSHAFASRGQREK